MILSAGDPRLHTRCMEVEAFDDELAKTVHRLRLAIERSALEGRPALGLAAPQIGVMRRVFVVAGWPEPFVNPVVDRVGPETEVAEEGCLSLPADLLVRVERPKRVWLSAQDSQGRVRRFKLRGRDARCALHELDHLDGVLVTDRAREQAA